MQLAKILSIFLAIFLLFSCQHNHEHSEASQAENESSLKTVLTEHINAIGKRDLTTLRSTLSPHGEMQLILDQMEIIESVDSFMKFHEVWFADTSAWTMDSKILNTTVGKEMGFGVVESIYREPLRDGVPYFNRLIVSYDLKKINGDWKVIKDHATSAEKSTD